MKKLCPLCGPKLSAFCMIMSAVTLFPDLHFSKEQEETGLTADVIEAKYSEKAVQCWIAAGMYVITLIVVFWQNKFNNTTQVF
uniref:Ribonuclease kappa n=1 Tax=Ditylenchus dipsaci TaxID=166011 RepID=A0A915CNE8_9BILA